MLATQQQQQQKANGILRNSIAIPPFSPPYFFPFAFSISMQTGIQFYPQTCEGFESPHDSL